MPVNFDSDDFSEKRTFKAGDLVLTIKGPYEDFKDFLKEVLSDESVSDTDKECAKSLLENCDKPKSTGSTRKEMFDFYKELDGYFHKATQSHKLKVGGHPKTDPDQNLAPTKSRKELLFIEGIFEENNKPLGYSNLITSRKKDVAEVRIKGVRPVKPKSKEIRKILLQRLEEKFSNPSQEYQKTGLKFCEYLKTQGPDVGVDDLTRHIFAFLSSVKKIPVQEPKTFRKMFKSERLSDPLLLVFRDIVEEFKAIKKEFSDKGAEGFRAL
jgi:hypothetical protein